MGLLSALGINNKKESVQAQYAPAVMGDSIIGFGYNTFGAGPMDRTLATQVPAVNRCANLIKGVIGYLPLELYKKSTGEQLPTPLWCEQPDIRQPRSVTISWTVDSLIFYGQAFWRVVSVFADDLRPSRFEWVANTRVVAQLNQLGTEVLYYTVDNQRCPDSGPGSLITFQGLTQGVLQTAGRTIQSALDIDRFKTDRIIEYYNHIVTAWEKWGFRKLRAEITVAQQTIVKELKESYLKPNGIALSIDEFRPTRHLGDKEERVGAVLEPKYDNMQIWHYKGGNCQTLEEELVMAHPPHDDIKDALSNAISIAIIPKQRVGSFSLGQNIMTHSRFGGVSF